ncbi:hypothetical protein PV10_07994 [Exophiala mesophila]|uniref:Xylanolytic transcriptional activator regulatory domain-containing protein n=1 Tax=Exophiala mesophila TaxID=212818 RepID=A0A0D1WHJ8_EXOME|nr:uncharacterized protein PV10_07994 [Exophiala mesophila]KIV88300.1 hypothetical protein PV10_07994 [Exophiala mesophila]
MLAESSLRPEHDSGNVSTQHTIENLDFTEDSNVDQRGERSLPVQSPYLGDTSNLLAERPTLRPDHENTTVFSTRLREQVLQIPGVVSLPSDLVFEAYADMYFEHLCHRFPVAERQDLFPVKRSIPLCQAICMVGSMLRQPRGEAPLAESEQYYTAAKMLIHLDYESDFIAILKTMCLLMTWNIKGHLILTFDCAWQWLGMACRLLNQMGLHLNQTYTRMANPKITRRIAWCIFIQDQLLSAAMGRPTAIKLHEFDVPPPTSDDFEIITRPEILFIELAKLAVILGRIQDLHARQPDNMQERSLILESLKTWLDDLPDEARLYDKTNHRIYRRSVSETHIMYFVVVITFFNLFGDQRLFSACSLATLVASSCVTRLYHEMYIRDDINYLLGINSWYMMVAAVPQLLYNTTPQQSDVCAQELDILVQALQHMKVKFAGAISILSTINGLRASRSHTKVRSGSPTSSSERHSEGTPYDMIVLRGLFPFPTSFSPRIDLTLVDGSQWMNSDLVDPLWAHEDFGCIFDEFWNVPMSPFETEGLQMSEN